MDLNTILTKQVAVSDPENWGGKKRIDVKMYPVRYSRSKTVRIFFSTPEVVGIYRDFDQWGFDDNWKWCKQWLYDQIPKQVSAKWLYKHGYSNY